MGRQKYCHTINALTKIMTGGSEGPAILANTNKNFRASFHHKRFLLKRGKYVQEVRIAMQASPSVTTHHGA
jgi:hypothetical protein